MTSSKQGGERTDLHVKVETERQRLERVEPHNVPIGGWRNRAIENVAAREGMNPYTVDHIIRGIG